MTAITFILVAASFAQVDLDRAASLITDQTNAFRQQRELTALTTNRELQKTAQYFADYLADQELEEDENGLDHEADGQTPAERAEEHGYKYCVVLENIAMHPPRRGLTAEAIAKSLAEGWLGSKNHRDNLLDPDVTETAVALARNEDSGRYFAVQMFGRPESARIEFSIDNETPSAVAYEINDREFTLKPGVTRTHTYCRPPQLVVQLGEERQKTLRPASGDVFEVANREGVLRVEKQAD